MLYITTLSSVIPHIIEDVCFTPDHVAIPLSLSLLVLMVPSKKLSKCHGVMINIDCQLDRT